MPGSLSLLRPLAMFALPLLLWALPMRVSPKALMVMAFGFWLVGGLMLSFNGVNFLKQTLLAFNSLVLPVVLAMVLGYAKGKFVLSKTSVKNIARLSALAEPQKLVAVYSQRSWVMIMLMVSIGALLTVFNAPVYWRGLVNLGIGMALIASSFTYVRYLASVKQPPATTPNA
jgi:hypothetical protein